MSRGLIYEVKESHKMAYVCQRGRNTFRVFMYDGYFDKEWEECTDSEDKARKIADRFCFN